MKLIKFCAVASIATNCVFISVFIFGVREKLADLGHPEAPASKVPVRVDNRSWNDFPRDNLVALRDELVKEGFPASVIRAILMAEIFERVDRAQKELLGVNGKVPFWKQSVTDPKINAELNQRSREGFQELKTLVGPIREGIEEDLRWSLPGFSDDNIKKLTAIRDRYFEVTADIYGESGFEAIGSGAVRLESLEKETREEIRAALSPAEFEDYELRTSDTAGSLRHNLSSFNATEGEFRTLFKLQSEYDEKYSPKFTTLTTSQFDESLVAQHRLDDQIAVALGPDRYAEYLRATDIDYQQATQLVARLNLPADVPNALYAVQIDTQKRRAEFLKNQSTSSSQEQIADGIEKLRQEAESQLSTIFNADKKAIEAYKQHGGTWLSRITP